MALVPVLIEPSVRNETRYEQNQSNIENLKYDQPSKQTPDINGKVMSLMTLDNFLNEFATKKVDNNCKYDVEVLKEDLLTDV